MLKSKLSEIQEQTFKEVLSALKTNGYCNMVRPTGFGKTYTLAKIASVAKGFLGVWRVVYVYPRDVIRELVIRDYHLDTQDMLFVSYNSLWNMCKGVLSFKGSPIELGKKYLFLFDESHFLGAAKWQQSYRTLEREFPDSYYLGATATPVRTSGVDVTEEFFRGRGVSTYSLNDAIKDGVFQQPLYSVGSINTVESCSKLYKTEENSEWVDKQEKKRYLKRLKERIADIQSICNCENIIKTEISKVYGEKPDYLKFICFFSRYDLLYAQYKDVKSWFKLAYPYMSVNSIIIGNDCAENRDMSRLFKLERHSNCVDLVMCVDKLSYGYHISDLSGVLMLRSTDSEVILGQQIGRALSITSKKRAIIFDWVGNVERLNVSEYNGSAIEATGLQGKRNKTALFSKDSVEFTNYYKDFEDILLAFNSKRAQRKSAVLFVLLNGVMPPWVACSELYVSPEELVRLLKEEGLYDKFREKSESKYVGWESKCR